MDVEHFTKDNIQAYIWVVWNYTGCGRNTTHILNCHLGDASELRQVAIVSSSS